MSNSSDNIFVSTRSAWSAGPLCNSVCSVVHSTCGCIICHVVCAKSVSFFVPSTIPMLLQYTYISLINSFNKLKVCFLVSSTCYCRIRLINSLCNVVIINSACLVLPSTSYYRIRLINSLCYVLFINSACLVLLSTSYYSIRLINSLCNVVLINSACLVVLSTSYYSIRLINSLCNCVFIN